MKHHTRSQQEQRQEQTSEQVVAASSSSVVREFASVEEVLRHDAAQTAVPPELTKKIQHTVAKLDPPKRSWWQRWLGR